MILGAATYTVTRHAATTWVDGFAVEGAATTWSIRGSLQPATARVLDLFPEGARDEAKWQLLFDRGELAVADRVTVDAAEYLVLSVSDWRLHAPLPYQAALLGEVTAS